MNIKQVGSRRLIFTDVFMVLIGREKWLKMKLPNIFHNLQICLKNILLVNVAQFQEHQRKRKGWNQKSGSIFRNLLEKAV